jgi:hypothetical protein
MRNTQHKSMVFILTFALMISSANVFALTPLSSPAQPMVSEKHIEEIAPDEGEKQQLGALSKQAAKDQLLATAEKMKVDYLKQRLERIKLENEIKLEQSPSLKKTTTSASFNNITPDLQLPSMPIIPAMTGESETIKDIPIASKKDVQKKTKPVIHLIEVIGVGDNLIARIQVDGNTKSYTIGDTLNHARTRIREITMDRVTLTNGTVLEI